MANKNGCSKPFGGCLVVIVLVGIGIYVAGSSIEKARDAAQERRDALPPEQRQAEDKANAEAKAKSRQDDELELRKVQAAEFSKEYVLKFLKHPDDASFGFWDIPTVTWNAEGDTFLVSSKVKAKNDFGAELTYRWATIIALDGKTWELASCVIDDKTVYASETLLSKLEAKKQSIDHERQAADKMAKAEAKREHQAEIEETKWRTWTDVNGQHMIDAKFGGMAAGTVTLTKRDGTSVKVPLEKLSNEDREWISNWKK